MVALELDALDTAQRRAHAGTHLHPQYGHPKTPRTAFVALPDRFTLKLFLLHLKTDKHYEDTAQCGDHRKSAEHHQPSDAAQIVIHALE
ncbi:MAG: hypothetical protein GWN53_17240 [Gammaproteobacteria bacterium]|nr:hypothetical protein [Gammaproteobacteria bacterium]